MGFFTWLTDESPALNLFPTRSTANYFGILLLYTTNTLRNWLVALLPSCQIRSYGHKWKSSTGYSNTPGYE